MNKIMRCLVVVVMGIFASMTLIFGTPAFATSVVTVSDSGKSLTSIFEGLKANPQLANFQQLRHPWRGTLQSRLPGVRNARITLGNFCPSSSTCEGNYAVIVNSGGCISTGCLGVTNFITDTTNGDCFQGARDSECGGGDAGPCCANWIQCDATNTIGCPR